MNIAARHKLGRLAKNLALNIVTRRVRAVQVPPGKTLVVKFADRASAGRASQRADVSAGYLHPQAAANGNGNGNVNGNGYGYI